MAVSGRLALAAWGVYGATPGSTEFFHHGACDASAAVALSDRAFVVANDEESWLRVYLRDESGSAVWSMDWAPFLEIDPVHPETDIEGAARMGDLIYWISSHARNKEGKWRESRHRLFATRIEATGWRVQLQPVGRPYRRLVDDLARHGPLRDLDLARASQLAPKDDGALNIEGLAAGREGTLWIGFRNPVPGGRALLVQLLNPAGAIEGEAARLGEVVRLDLAGRGIRDMVWTGRDYLLVAGSFDGRGKSRVYRWAGPGDEPRRMREIDLADFNAEAAIAFPGAGGAECYLLSDDSGREVEGVPCRELRTAGLRSFRSLRIR